MPRPKREPLKSYSFISYDVDDFVGSVGVYLFDGEWGTKVLAIPKLNICTTIIEEHKTADVRELFNSVSIGIVPRSRTEKLKELILRDL